MLRVLSFSLFRKLGLYSYSIYLWQQPFYVLKNEGILSATSASILALIVGISSYYFIEFPIRTYLNRTWGARKIDIRSRISSDGIVAAPGGPTHRTESGNELSLK